MKIKNHRSTTAGVVPSDAIANTEGVFSVNIADTPPSLYVGSGSGVIKLGSAISSTEPTDPTEGVIWVNSTSGDVFMYVNGEWLKLNGGGGEFKVEEQTATAGQTVFNLVVISYEANKNKLSVYRNGVRLRKSDFQENSSTQVTLNEPASLGDEMFFLSGNEVSDSDTANITISDNPPSDPVAGSLWMDSSDANLPTYIWYVDVDSAQWVLQSAPNMSVDAVQKNPEGGSAQTINGGLNVTGNVGIGTSSPVEKLQVSGGAIFQQGAGNYLGVFRPTQFAKLAIGTDIDNCVYFQDAGTQNLAIGRTASGSSTESMRIDSSGNVGINKDPAGNARLVLEYNGGAQPGMRTYDTQSLSNTYNVWSIYRNGSQVGTVTTTLSATAYNTSSDYRLKEDIQPMADAITRLMSLNPVNFAWKADGSRVDGFIAHEAQAVVPEAVTGEKDAVDAEGNPEYQGIDQSKLVPLLVATVQELVKRIEELENK